MPSLRTRAASAFTVLAVLAVGGTIAFNESFRNDEIRQHAEALTGGNAARGRQAFVQIGCGGCHTVKGVPQADGLVGPPLDGIAERTVIAGTLANTPDNLEHWIATPQSVVPGNAMPDMPMTGQQASDIAAFLYTRT